MSKHYNVASIAVLDYAGSPPTIPWLIVAIIIYSVNRESVWTWTHVSVKSHEVLLPFVAHGNSALTIVLVCGLLRIKASLLYSRPDPVFTFMNHAVNIMSFSGKLIFATGTAFLSAVCKVVTNHGPFLAAVA